VSNRADILIIGAGVVGLGIAYELSNDNDLTVAVFDKEGPGAGTSGRSAGVICRHDQGPIYQRLSLIGHQAMRRFEAEQGFTFNAWGSLNVVRSPGTFPPQPYGRELVDAPSGMYVEEVLDRAALLERFPWIDGEDVLGGVFEPNVGFINPFELMDLYRSLLDSRGNVTVDYGNPVLELRRTGDRITEVATRRGLWSADVVINASGAWANKVAALAGTSVHITPQRMNVAVATTYDDGDFALPLHGVPQMEWEGDGVWCRGETGGGALFGQHRDKTEPSKPTADPDHFDHLPDAGFTERLKPHVERYYRLPKAKVLSGWTCVYDTSDDGYPIVGYDPQVSNLVHAVGMNGHGMTIHAGIARCISSLVVNGSTSVDISDVMPWPEQLDFSILRPDRFDRNEQLALRGGSGGH
jgi:sarcosine oxidase, subunit beta